MLGQWHRVLHGHALGARAVAAQALVQPGGALAGPLDAGTSLIAKSNWPLHEGLAGCLLFDQLAQGDQHCASPALNLAAAPVPAELRAPLLAWVALAAASPGARDPPTRS